MLTGDEYRCGGSNSHQRHGFGVHRPERMPRGALTATCRHCGRDIRRAHRRSTWWRVDVKDSAPESFPRVDDPGEGDEC